MAKQMGFNLLIYYFSDFSEDSFSPSDHIDDIDFDDEDHTYGPYRSLSMAKYSPLSSVALRKHHPRLMNRWPHWPSVRVNLTRGNGSEVTCHRLFDSFEFVYAKQVSDQVPTVTLVDDAFLVGDGKIDNLKKAPLNLNKPH